MRLPLLLLLTGTFATIGVSAAPAQKPPKAPEVTFAASANTITFSNPVTLDGAVKGAKAGVPVTLQQRRAGGTLFADVQTLPTDNGGRFSFVQRPSKSSTFRVTAGTTPPATSGEQLVAVAPLVGFRVGDTTPRRGQRVRFRGRVYPQHDARRVSIQRRRADGVWVVVARPRLRDAGGGYSTYRRRLRIRRTSVYRVEIAGHGDHATGTSRERTLTVG